MTRPRALAAAARLLTAPGLGGLLAGGWSIYWNELLSPEPTAARTKPWHAGSTR